MRAKVIVTFDGIVENKRFRAGKVYEFGDDRFEYLRAKGYVEKAGDDVPRRSAGKAKTKDE